MWEAIAAGLLATAGLVGNYFSNRTQKKNQLSLMQEQHKLNEQSADKALEREQEMYNYTYNKTSPLAMVENLKQAGLSPGLMYGQGGSIGTNAQVGNALAATTGLGQAAQMNVPEIDPLTAAQIANINADTKNKEKEGEQTQANTEYLNELTNQIEMNGELSRLAQMYEILNEAYQNSGKAGEDFRMEIGDRVFEINGQSIKGQTIVQNMTKTMLECMKTGNEAQKAIAEAAESNARIEKMYNDMLMDAMEIQIQLRHLDILDEQNQINWARYEDEKGKGAREWKNLEIMENQAKAMATKIEYETGQKVNWKNITETVISGISAIGNTIGQVYGAKKIGAMLGPKETYTSTQSDTYNGSGKLRSTTRTTTHSRGNK